MKRTKTGKLSIWESTLSKRPPWPGRKSLESYTSKDLLIFDSNKSPKTPNKIKINETNKVGIVSKSKLLLITRYIANDPVIKPAKKPSTVLFGDISSYSFLLPYRLPNSYAAISEMDIEISAKNVNNGPAFWST